MMVTRAETDLPSRADAPLLSSPLSPLAHTTDTADKGDGKSTQL